MDIGPRDWIRPRALRPGDLIGVCSPSGFVDSERLQRGVRELEGLGFRVRVPEGVLSRSHFTAGSAARRRAELEALFAAEDVAAIVCARGGAGAAALLREIDRGCIAANPKPFVGYSDVTAVHLLLNRLRLVSVHGPMLARDLAGGTYHEASLLHALTGSGAPYRAPAGQLEGILVGEGEGVLVGGCLSLLASAAGTPWALDPSIGDVVLFAEDVGEPAYRIDRMLRQLEDSGALANVRGIVLGTLPGCQVPPDADYTVSDVIRGGLERLGIPVARGLPSGHADGEGVSLPLGVRARLRVEATGIAEFSVLEKPVS
jgi:muramoyltetrapeptide carboxypeptidase